jgi:hypothetical protein
MKRSSASLQVSAVAIRLPSVMGEDAERGGRPKDHEELAPNVVEGHRKICAAIGQRPLFDLLLRDAVHDRDAAGTRHVDEDLGRIGVDLEAFGMLSLSETQSG